MTSNDALRFHTLLVFVHVCVMMVGAHQRIQFGHYNENYCTRTRCEVHQGVRSIAWNKMSWLVHVNILINILCTLLLVNKV